jgi:RimJ/RimL family protein N-acetyltransferase
VAGSLASGGMVDEPTATASGAVSVRLAPWADGDLPLLHQLLGDPAMTEHIGGPETPEQIVARHARYLAHAERDPVFRVVDEATGASAGWVGYWAKEWRGRPIFETGWSVLPAFQGRGIARAATALVIERAQADARRRRYLHAFPSPENAPSNAVCRRLGFELLGAVDFEYPPGQVHPSNDWRLDLHPLTVRPIDLAQTRPLRQAVLRPHNTLEELADHEAAGALAVGAFDGEGRLVATGLVGRDGEDGGWRIRGMATVPEVRGQGAGAAVLDVLVEQAQQRGATHIWCNARSPARTFYERAGFAVVSGEFELPEIGPHFVMERRR